MITNQNCRLLVVASLVSALVGCGSSDSSGDDTGGGIVSATNNAPVANAGADQSINVDQQVTLDASASSDADGDTLTYSWTIASAPSNSQNQLNNSEIVNPNFIADVAGEYEFTVTVSDGEDSDTDSVIITAQAVSAGNSAPVANAGSNQTVTVDEQVTLDASASSDADGDTLTYSWSFTSTPTDSQAQLSSTTAVNPTFTADVAGDYEVTVTVSDGEDNDSDSVVISASSEAVSQDYTGEFIINNSDTSDYISNVFEDVQTAEYQTIGGVEYLYVEATGIPKYDVTMTQDIIDALNDRPNASSDFRGSRSTTTASVDDVVTFGQDIGYRSSSINCDDTGGDGYWPPGPACPTNQEKQNYFPAEPEITDSQCETSLGEVGTMVNGTSLYNWGDGMSEGSSVWWTLAPKAEFYDVDICGGHATTDGDYHHHFYTQCLADLVGDDGSDHSPIYGFAADGYPVYGPYESDGVLAVSGWVARDYGAPESEGGCNTEGERTCTLVNNLDVSEGVETAEQGPDIGATVTSQSGNDFIADDGFYFEDYYFAQREATGAQLDQHNGHDNNDGRGYHYHITLELDDDGNLVPSFPFTVGPNFKGDLPDNTFAGCNGSMPSGPR